MLALSESFVGGVFNPQWLTIPLVVLSYRYTERKHRFHLSQVWVNTFGILAVVLTGFEYFQQQFGSRTETGAFAGAHLLVFLTWIVLFQKKENRQYWSLCVLSGLHVAVGAVLTNSEIYGFFIFVYLFFILWTLTVYSLFRDVEKYSHSKANREPDDAAEFEDDSSQIASHQSLPGFREESRDSQGFASVHVLRQERWINSRFAWSVFNMASLVLVISAFFFFLIPRRWMGEGWNVGKNSLPPAAISGFADEVQLGTMGEILTSNKRVMQVRLYNNDTNKIIDIQKYAEKLGYNEPLFRGKVLDRYSNGVWNSEYGKGSLSTNSNPNAIWQTDLMGSDPRGERIRQEIILEPLGTNVLFAIADRTLKKYNAAKITGEKTLILFEQSNYMLIRPPRVASDKSLAYEIFVPNIMKKNTPESSGIQQLRTAKLHLETPGAEFPTLKRLARQIVEDPSRSFQNNAEKALALTSFLKETGGFTYSLTTTIQNPQIDPVEDFLQRKSGHCEYFASALTLMLREVGIPARMVSGFKGGNVNKFSGYFEVEQRHAHVWVEAYLNQRWVVFDPTPAARDDSVESMAQGSESWRAFMNYVSFLWGKYILGVSLEQQNKNIYIPLKEKFLETFQVAEGRTSFFALLKDFLTNKENWSGWKGALLVLAMAASLGLLYLLTRVLLKLLLSRSAKREEYLRRKRIVVEFYERFRAICEKMGYVREKAQTHLEFSNSVERQLRPILQQSHAVAVPQTITRAFYEIRFGKISLSNIQLDDMKSSVLRLERAISDSDGNLKR